MTDQEPVHLRRVTLYRDRVEKYTDTPQAMAAKYDALHRLAARHGFVSPRVLGVGKASIMLERIADIHSVRDVYLNFNHGIGDADRQQALFRRIGEILALFHREMPVADAQPWMADAFIARRLRRYYGRSVDVDRLPRATLHGDFGFSNVFIQGDDLERPTVVILDPCGNGGITRADWLFGPVHIDIGEMLSCLEGRIPFRQQTGLRRDCTQMLQAAFIGGYADVSGMDVDAGVAHAFAYSTAAAQFRFRFGRFGALFTGALYNRYWKANFPLGRRSGFVEGTAIS